MARKLRPIDNYLTRAEAGVQKPFPENEPLLSLANMVPP